MNRLIFRLVLVFALLTIAVVPALCDDVKTEKVYSEQGKVVIAKGDKQFVPFEFINEKGEPDGFSVDLFRALMKKIDIPYTLTLDDWDKVQDELAEKKIDLAIGMIYSSERASHLKFGIPHCMISYNIICRKNNDFLHLEDLKGKSIIVQNKDRAHEYLLSSKLTDKIVTVDNIYDGIKLLASGNHDAVLSFDVTSFYYVRKGHFGNLRVHLTDIEPERYSIVVNTDNEELIYLLNTAIYQMKIDGEYDKIYYRWFGIFEKNKIYKTVWYILAALGALLLLAFFFVWLLRTKIREKTDILVEKNNETLRLVDELRAENERRQVIEQNLILAKNKAEESDRLKSAFLANMSHEIRTPLNAIVGFSSILNEIEDAAMREEYINVIRKNNDQLLQLINDLLDLSKIESEAMQVNKSIFNISELCENEMVSFSSLHSKPGITFKKELIPQCMVFTDMLRVSQMIDNFLSNALKFTEAGVITIGVKRTDNHQVEIYVQDTGIGIEEDLIDSIFTRFVKLNTFTQGTGLGLSICKHIAKLLDIRIGAESRPGRGSRFWIRMDECVPE